VKNPQENSATIATSSRQAGSAAVHDDVLLRGAGILTMAERKIVRVVGDDRVSFLHGTCSNDIRNARPGAVVPALFLTEHAHVIADFFAWIADESILIEIEEAAWTRAREHLEKLLVADDVEFEEQTNLVVDIEGPRAQEAVRAVAGDMAIPDAWRWGRGEHLAIASIPRFGTTAFTILIDRDHAGSVVATVEALGEEFREVGRAEIDVLRIENGIARVGTDTSDKTIALEARLTPAISFDKGCYVGQETIERATARGGVKRKLCGLRFEGGRSPELNAPLRLEGKEVGRLTSVALSPQMGLIGLGILHHSAWQPGTRLIADDPSGEIPGEVSDIPFRGSLK
jgi:folate-binding protein YgfZ